MAKYFVVEDDLTIIIVEDHEGEDVARQKFRDTIGNPGEELDSFAQQIFDDLVLEEIETIIT